MARSDPFLKIKFKPPPSPLEVPTAEKKSSVGVGMAVLKCFFFSFFTCADTAAALLKKRGGKKKKCLRAKYGPSLTLHPHGETRREKKFHPRSVPSHTSFGKKKGKQKKTFLEK